MFEIKNCITKTFLVASPNIFGMCTWRVCMPSAASVDSGKEKEQGCVFLGFFFFAATINVFEININSYNGFVCLNSHAFTNCAEIINRPGAHL